MATSSSSKPASRLLPGEYSFTQTDDQVAVTFLVRRPFSTRDAVIKIGPDWLYASIKAPPIVTSQTTTTESAAAKPTARAAAVVIQGKLFAPVRNTESLWQIEPGVAASLPAPPFIAAVGAATDGATSPRHEGEDSAADHEQQLSPHLRPALSSSGIGGSLSSFEVIQPMPQFASSFTLLPFPTSAVVSLPSSIASSPVAQPSSPTQSHHPPLGQQQHGHQASLQEMQQLQQRRLAQLIGQARSSSGNVTGTIPPTFTVGSGTGTGAVPSIALTPTNGNNGACESPYARILRSELSGILRSCHGSPRATVDYVTHASESQFIDYQLVTIHLEKDQPGVHWPVLIVCGHSKASELGKSSSSTTAVNSDATNTEEAIDAEDDVDGTSAFALASANEAQDPERALSLYRVAVRRGHVDGLLKMAAITHLGQKRVNGSDQPADNEQSNDIAIAKYVVRDEARAFEYHQMAADLGDATACYVVGLSLVSGKGVPGNVINAQVGLQYLLESIRLSTFVLPAPPKALSPTAQPPPEAADLAQTRAVLTDAAFQAGVVLSAPSSASNDDQQQTGQPTSEPDFDLAAACFQLAAVYGRHAHSMFNLGILLHRGMVGLDLSEDERRTNAGIWFERSIKVDPSLESRIPADAQPVLAARKMDIQQQIRPGSASPVSPAAATASFTTKSKTEGSTARESKRRSGGSSKKLSASKRSSRGGGGSSGRGGDDEDKSWTKVAAAATASAVVLLAAFALTRRAPTAS
ncbi:hypothetical protein GQ42DRAFT_177737 [Ramicandelaber brevisporus]|nr:hypothetical protein GQ42DRAFT_177737 [Ramicandelaber brevisporus]